MPSTGTSRTWIPEGAFFSKIVDEKVLEAIDALPPEFREVLVLSDMEGMSYGEIAETLKIPVGTVKSRLFRARRQLQACSVPLRGRDRHHPGRGRPAMSEAIDCREAHARLHDYLKQELTPELAAEVRPTSSAAGPASSTPGSSRASW